LPLPSSSHRIFCFLKLSAVADAGVAVGIVGEVMLGMWNNRIQTELRKRSNASLSDAVKLASEANERAAKADLETERLRAQLAWREISPEQEALLKHSLSKFPGASVISRVTSSLVSFRDLGPAHMVGDPSRGKLVKLV
jgi:hypothetical protein